ncbi:MAG: glycosyltransferase, partial [Brevundimonas sp.]
LDIDTAHHPARDELIRAGGRSRLPDAAFGRSAATDAFMRLSSALRRRDAAADEIAAISTYPTEAWDAFRRAYPIASAPGQARSSAPVSVVIDAADAEPAALRVTLGSLLDQRVPDWTALVRAGSDLHDHPVASLAHQDERIVFDDIDAAATPQGSDAPILLCSAGLALDPEALGWLLFAATRTGAQLVYADHDHHTSDWRLGQTFADPVLLGAPDRFDLETHPHPPAALLACAEAHEVLRRRMGEGVSGAPLRRALLLDVLGAGRRAAHLPRVLSSLRVAELNGATPERPSPRPLEKPRRRPNIRLVIPTRDQPELLTRCVTSVLGMAADPDAIEVQIIAHRVDAAASVAISALADKPAVRVHAFDEPFNWSRMNNIHARDAAAETLLVFANDDMEMLTPGWDDHLAALLNEPDVGIVGARLLYPDNSIQHAGVALGANRGRPVHEGLGRPALQGGPDERWCRRRQVAAVTGAFLALREDLFRRLGGFDERLAVGYSDLDLCLKARAAGAAVVYEPSIELIHHESPTRGRNDTASRIAWDNEELSAFHARWQGWMMHDPGRNPHWVGDGERPFDGLRDLGRWMVIRHLDQSAVDRPWAAVEGRSPWDDDDR